MHCRFLGTEPSSSRVGSPVRLPFSRMQAPGAAATSSWGFPKWSNWRERSESEQTRTRSGLSRSEQTGTRSDGVAVSGDESPESVRRFSRSANPKGAEVIPHVLQWGEMSFNSRRFPPAPGLMNSPPRTPPCPPPLRAQALPPDPMALKSRNPSFTRKKFRVNDGQAKFRLRASPARVNCSYFKVLYLIKSTYLVG